MTDHKLTTTKRFLRVSEILAPAGPVPVGKSTWWQGVKEGRFPQPIKLGPRITVWKIEDIERLLSSGVGGSGFDDHVCECGGRANVE